MARRMKRHSLGASAEEHGAEREKAEKRALSYLKDADESAASGKCTRAIRDLAKAATYVGMFRAHRQSGGSGSGRWSMDSLQNYLDGTGVRVTTACSIDTPERTVKESWRNMPRLSGKSRRRTRR